MNSKRCLALSLLFCLAAAGVAASRLSAQEKDVKWISLFNGQDLKGWTVRGKAEWKVENGVLVGRGGMGHIYADPVVRDLEVKGRFRVSAKGNSGFYFRSHWPTDDPDRFPRGYEAQIDNGSKAFTGWLWKPGTPTCEAKSLITRDDEWFELRIEAVGDRIRIWVNEKLMTECQDKEYTEGRFAVQGHNPGMTIEAKDLFYRPLSPAKP